MTAHLPQPEFSYLFKAGELLLGAGDRAAWDPAAVLDLPVSGRRLYRCQGRICEALRLAPDADLDFAGSGETRSLPFRLALSELPAEDAARAARGLALLNWLEVAMRCGGCGGVLADDEKEGFEAGARRCPDCKRIFYPRVSPAVIILVRREDRILLAHNASFPAGRFGLIAGFVEPGETLEEAARRELREEASMEVSSLRYVSSQPWPFPDSLMIAFEAVWAAGEGEPDGVEIAELRWCGRDDLPSIPPKGSVARSLIDGFLTGGSSGPAIS